MSIGTHQPAFRSGLDSWSHALGTKRRVALLESLAEGDTNAEPKGIGVCSLAVEGGTNESGK